MNKLYEALRDLNAAMDWTTSDEDVPLREKVNDALAIKLERTGNIFSFASTEYQVTYPDGHVGTLWSPPWHEWNDNREDAEALKAAQKLFDEGKHKNEEPTNVPRS